MKRRLVCIIYLLLTVFGIFTALINDQREENPTLILKAVPTTEYYFKGADSDITFYENKYEWYKNNEYLEILHLHGNAVFTYIYIAVVWCWRIITIAIIVGLPFYTIKSKHHM